ISSPLFSGRHRMDENGAFMLIKLLGRFPLVDASGPEMDQAEQVTYLNDLCLIAPAALVHAPLSWETIDDRTVKVTLSQYSYHVSAILSFGEKGELINFVSYDRFSTPDGRNPKNYPWSTPVENYMLWEGLNIPGLAKAIWHYPEGDHCYAKFRVGTFVSNPKRPLF
ncbi:MAG TPA: hypothetical protein PLK12_13430, partial [Prolixibacteraceae bacterium]|nr:hypothetical protein [Prolixibacteraceae bacterium]